MVLNDKSLSHLDYNAYLTHKYWIEQAIALAEEAGNRGDVPVGAIITDKSGKLLAAAANSKEQTQDATAHAEILAIRQANQKKNNWHLDDCTLYVTLEPCPMCAGAIIQARISLLVYGTDDPKTGAIYTAINLPHSSASNHSPKVIAGVQESQCRRQLQDWFAKKRK
ncbi:MAG: nucleoside deaminase [Xenococcaceae cyanobacterium MO_167.B27]|nr:nucleoside deaminase [Xenococcaceae cyanobacterium MO_167.B27]